ncbi:MAG: hypothetical protein HYR96_11335 [Deltaproteobacteria bacterium]|nr:hypothetical protein [Deltaproteobacteria bacterium]MBI3293276.1 hypothetical protein [Deltaproteobacteria bacterium]
MRRRGFIGWVISVLAGTALVRCSDEPSNDRSFTSTLSGSHTHNVTITQESWNHPSVDGTSYATTNNYQHVHTVTLTYEQLLSLSQGYEVKVKSSLTDHDHTFTLLLNET